MATPPWIVPDELWELIEPLLPKHERRLRYPGRKRLPDRLALCGILFVLHTGIAWRTAWRCAASSSCCTPASPAGAPGAVRHPLRAAHRHRVGAPRRRPDRLLTDRGYDHDLYRKRSASGGSSRRSPAVVPPTAPASVASAGWSSAASPGCTASAACWSATSGAPTPTRRSSPWPAA